MKRSELFCFASSESVDTTKRTLGALQERAAATWTIRELFNLIGGMLRVRKIDKYVDERAVVAKFALCFTENCRGPDRLTKRPAFTVVAADQWIEKPAQALFDPVAQRGAI